MRKDRIEELLKSRFEQLQCFFEDESSQHSRGGDETHLKVLLVSNSFDGLNRVQRQQSVLKHLDEEFQSGLHAFTLRCLTQEEFSAGKAEGFVSPECLGKARVM